MNVKFFIILLISFFGCCLGDCGLESCNDLKVVKECKNVERCISEVWLKQKPTGQRDDICSICLKMVKEARDQLMSNETRSDIKAVLDGSCDLLRIKPIVLECRKLADEFVPELVAILSSQMDPEVVCSVAKLCNNKLYETSKECLDCLNFAQAAEDLIENIPAEEFKNEMLQICRSMGSYSDACFYYTPFFVDFYYNQTKYALKKQPCEVTGMCPKDSSLPREPHATSWKDARNQMCSLCPNVMTKLKSQALTVNSLKDFKLQIFKVCRSLALFKNSCARILDGHYSQVFKYVTQKFEPVEFCEEKFVFCSRRPDDAPVFPLLPATESSDAQLNFEDFLSQSGVLDVMLGGEVAEDVNSNEKIVLPVGDPVEHKGPLLGVRKDDSCKNCVEMFQVLADKLRSEDVHEILIPVCLEMSDSESCLNLLERYSGKMLKFFLENFDAKKICPELVPQCKVYSELFLDSKPSREGACSFCLKSFHSLNEGLKGNELLPEVQQALTPMCHSIPEASRAICESFVKSMVSVAAKEVAENETCGRLKLCGPEPELPGQVEEVESKESCKVCLLVVQTVYDQIQEQSNEDEIRKLLEEVCHRLPKKIQGPCNAVVITYMNEILKMLMDNLKPEDVCRKLSFCDAWKTATSAVEEATTQRTQTEVQGLGKIPCNFCLTAIRMLMDELQDNKTEEAIRNAVDGLCNYMPQETRDTCRNLINQYTEDIIDMIIADFNATEICVYLKICGPHPMKLVSVPSFGVSTNEIRDRYNPVEACDMCKFMAAKSNVDNGDEELLALLVDICMVDTGTRYKDCKKSLEDKVLPYGGKTALADFDDVCGELKICPLEKRAPEKELLQKMHSAVQECALCETLVQIIASHESMLEEDYDFSQHASLICLTVPRDKKSQCESMLISYGPSIVNLLNNGTEVEDVCYRVVLCDEGQQAKLRMPVSAVEPTGFHECMEGPSFWCKNEENAKKCGTLPHCKLVVWKDGKAPK